MLSKYMGFYFIADSWDQLNIMCACIDVCSYVSKLKIIFRILTNRTSKEWSRLLEEYFLRNLYEFIEETEKLLKDIKKLLVFWSISNFESGKFLQKLKISKIHLGHHIKISTLQVQKSKNF